MNIDTESPAKLRPLMTLNRWRYKVLWGGRGGAKSWGAARALLLLAASMKLRIVCGREVQKTLAESSHQLLQDQMQVLGLQGCFRVTDTEIVGRNGSQFLFHGLRHDPAGLKSLEGADILWVDEAAPIAACVWDTVIPTMRRAHSELWITFNPDLDSDETYRRFVLDPPSTALVIKINWRDNPYFPEVLRIEKDDLARKNPKAYQHVWEGETKSALSGAIFEAEIAEAEAEHRIGNVPRDRTRPISTFWDLGFGDATAIWFAQAMPDGSIRVIDYLENSGKTIEWYVIQLQQRNYLYDTHYLPHDAVDAIIHQKLGGGDPSMSIEMLLRKAGLKVRVAPKLHVTSRINAARTMFGACWFDRTKCADGLQSLRHYQWAPPSIATAAPDPRPNAPAGVPGKVPLHSWASHGADAYCVLGVTLKTPQKAAPPPPPPPPGHEYSWMG